MVGREGGIEGGRKGVNLVLNGDIVAIHAGGMPHPTRLFVGDARRTFADNCTNLPIAPPEPPEIYIQGACTYDVRKILGFLGPLPLV